MSGAVCLLPHMPSWHLQERLFPFVFIMIEEPVTEAQILHVFTLSDITSKFRTIAVLIIVD